VSDTLNTLKKYAPAGVFFVCLTFLILVGGSVPEADLVTRSGDIDADAAISTDSSDTASVSDRGLTPTRLRIPSLNVEANFGPTLGLTANQEVEVPVDYTEVGWYQHSPIPGNLGPAVVLGHVDSRTGPAVFYALGQLESGEEVVIQRSDGSEVVFEVTRSEVYDQDSFPTELVYGDIDHVGLRLVTCSGWYDREEGRYSHNRVVYAQQKDVL